MSESRITLTVTTGEDFKQHSVTVPISQQLERELSASFEIENESVPLTLPPNFDDIVGYFKLRDKTYRLRGKHAKEIAEHLTALLVEYFERNDTVNGYRKGDY